MASNLIRGFGRACYSLTLSIMLPWNGYSVKHAHSFSIPLRVLAGPGSIYWSIYKPAHATSLIKEDPTDETTYWLSNRIPMLIFALSQFLFPSCPLSLSLFLWRNPTLSLPLFPSLACLQVDCCSQCGAGVQSLQISAEHGTVQPGSFQKCSNTMWFHSQCIFLNDRCQQLYLLWVFFLPMTFTLQNPVLSVVSVYSPINPKWNEGNQEVLQR